MRGSTRLSQRHGITPVAEGTVAEFCSTGVCCVLQERMANNHVYVFRKSQPSKYAYVAECR